MLNVETFVFNPFSENTYIVYDDTSKEGCIIDPGCYGKDEENEIITFIEDNGITLKYMFNTHGHIDHILGNYFIKNKYNSKFYYPKGELYFLDLMINEAANYGVTLIKSPLPDEYFTEDLILQIGAYKIQFISTPGHSPDEYCIYFPEIDVCFTGDVLFEQSIGRTDLWDGNYQLLINSIMNKLYILPDKTKILPGHGRYSGIAHEKQFNPYVAIK